MEEAMSLFVVAAIAGMAALSLVAGLLARMASRSHGADLALALGQGLLAISATMLLGCLIGDDRLASAADTAVAFVVPVVLVWAALALVDGVHAARRRELSLLVPLWPDTAPAVRRRLVPLRLEPAPAMLCAVGATWLVTVIVEVGLNAAPAIAVIAGTGVGLLAGLLVRSAAWTAWLGSGIAWTALVVTHVVLVGAPWVAAPLVGLVFLAAYAPPSTKRAPTHLTREQRAH
jgi:hypothetical protein